MEKLIVQQANRHGSLAEFVKSTGESMTLGRGFDNDIILSDHFIAPEQIRFYVEDGLWKIKILDFTNTVLINDQPANDDAVIGHGDKLVIGRTHLVLLLSNHAIEQTRTLVLSNWMNDKIHRRALPFVMLFLSALAAVFVSYQEVTGKIRWGQLISTGLAQAVFITLWASSWALIGRLLRHKPNFREQLFYTALMGIVLSLGRLFYGYAEYTTTSYIFGLIIEWIFLLAVIGTLLKYNLSYSTILKRRGLISYSVAALLLVITYSQQHLEQQDFSTLPEYSATLKPPLAKVSPDTSIENYLRDFEAIFEELKKSSIVEPSA